MQSSSLETETKCKACGRLLTTCRPKPLLYGCIQPKLLSWLKSQESVPVWLRVAALRQEQEGKADVS